MGIRNKRKDTSKRDWSLICNISFRLLSPSLGMALLYFLFLWIAWDTPLVQHIGEELRNFGIPLLLGLIVVICTWNIDDAFPWISNSRFSFSSLTMAGTLFLGIVIGFQMNQWKSSVLHVETLQQIKNLMETDWVHVSHLETDTTYSGTYTHVVSRPQRHGADKLYFEMLDVYEVNKMPNVYVGTKFTSREYSAMTSEEKLNQYYNDFFHQGINRHAYPLYNQPYLLKHEHHSDLYKGFVHAITNGHFNDLSTDDAIIFRLADESESPSGHFNIAVICWIALAYSLLIILIVIFGKPDRKKYEERDDLLLRTIFNFLLTLPVDAKEEKHKGEIRKSEKTEHTWHIIMAILIALPPIVSIVYYLAMVFSGVSLMSPDVSEIISWGGANSYLVMGLGEWWRIATAFFLHGNLMHIAYNLINYWLILYLYVFAIGSRRVILSFYITGLLSTSCAILFSPHTVIGISGGLMGMYGYIIINSLLTPKHKDGIWFPVIMVGITLLFSFQATVSLAGHLSGLLVGIILAIIYYLYDRRETILD